MSASYPAESTVVDFFRPLLLRLTSGRQALSPVPEVKIRSPSSGEVYRWLHQL